MQILLTLLGFVMVVLYVRFELRRHAAARAARDNIVIKAAAEVVQRCEAQAAAVDHEIQTFTAHLKGLTAKNEGAYAEILAHVRQESDRVSQDAERVIAILRATR